MNFRITGSSNNPVGAEGDSRPTSFPVDHETYDENRESQRDNTALSDFMKKHDGKYPMLGPVDFFVCVTLCNDMRGKFGDNKKKMLRQLQMRIHLDKKSICQR
jgi:hypothetical protein